MILCNLIKHLIYNLYILYMYCAKSYTRWRWWQKRKHDRREYCGFVATGGIPGREIGSRLAATQILMLYNFYSHAAPSVTSLHPVGHVSISGQRRCRTPAPYPETAIRFFFQATPPRTVTAAHLIPILLLCVRHPFYVGGSEGSVFLCSIIMTPSYCLSELCLHRADSYDYGCNTIFLAPAASDHLP